KLHFPGAGRFRNHTEVCGRYGPCIGADELRVIPAVEKLRPELRIQALARQHREGFEDREVPVVDAGPQHRVTAPIAGRPEGLRDKAGRIDKPADGPFALAELRIAEAVRTVHAAALVVADVGSYVDGESGLEGSDPIEAPATQHNIGQRAEAGAEAFTAA